jgi:hypothetical protein
MILREVVDTLIRSVSGGVNTIDNKYEPRYVEALVPQLREQAIKLDYFGGRNNAASRRLDYAYTQQVTVNVDTGLNNNLDYVTFTIPKPLSLGRMVNGLVYVGQENNAVSFAQMYNREDIANAKARGMFDGSVIAFFWEGGKLEVYGNKMLTEVNIRGVFSDPTVVSGFSIEADDYPVNEALLLIMTDLFKANQNINVQKPADSILDNADTDTRAVTANNIRQS